MEKFREIDGDLIKLANAGEFDVIAHGCNCFCTMGAGIAPQMARAFGCDKYPMEQAGLRGDINKLGQIDFEIIHISRPITRDVKHHVTVVNAYTQYRHSAREKPFDMEAFTLCMRKMNFIFAGDRIGLPAIGSGLAGGDFLQIREVMKRELKDCFVTLVIYKP